MRMTLLFGAVIGQLKMLRPAVCESLVNYACADKFFQGPVNGSFIRATFT